MSTRRTWVVLAALGFTLALVVVAIVASGDDDPDDAGTSADTEDALLAVEVFLQEEGIENYDLATLDLAVESLMDSCANDDTTGFLLTYALTLQGDEGDDELARAVVEAVCPERLDELDQAP
jgi:hypothetical protein